MGQRHRKPARLSALASVLAALVLPACSHALPNNPAAANVAARAEQVADPAPSVWVSVDHSGGARTVTPVVTVTNGASTTVSAPPESLTKTATYTLSPSGHVSTLTGAPPVATAASSDGAGEFLACQVYQADDAPFCQPQDGSLLNPGRTYYVTWSGTYFNNPDTTIELQGAYQDGTQKGFTSDRLPASRGFYVWNIPSDFLTNMKLNTLSVALSLMYSANDSGTLDKSLPGPTVVVTKDGSSAEAIHGGHKGVSAAAVAVPIVVVLVLVGMAGLCFWSYRRHGTVPLLGAVKRRRSSGYGVGQSWPQRVGSGAAGGGAAPAAWPEQSSFAAARGGAPGGFASDKSAGGNSGIQLTDRDSWSPTGGRNVFREELQRQQERET